MPRPTRRTLALALACAALVGGTAHAQSSPGGFQLPDPSPTPTPAPQGPVDERAGVPIAPRIIPEQRNTSAPTPTPTPAPTQTLPPIDAATPEPSASETQSTAATPPPATSSETPPTQSSAPGPTTSPTAQPATQAGPAAGPADTALPEIQDDTRPSIGPDDWYNVDQQGEESGASVAGPQIDTDIFPDAGSGSWIETDGFFTQTRNLAFAGVMLVLLLGGGLWLWRRRRAAQEPLALPAPALAAGVRKSIAATRPTASPMEPPPPPPAEPLEVDLALEIVSASRSVMMFMIDYRLDIANRSESAARDIEISAHLTCAQRGGSNAPPLAGGQPVGVIERIGPHQSRSVSGQLQIPLTEVQAIKQGQKPLFIPLLHVSIVSAGDHVLKRSFVVGAPSTASQARVHPIALDTPPGGIPGLKAREVSLETA
ncbi:MAG: LPXTG cell wall anchor domain-containing protein [Pseudomonadota bacterium]